jgi:hypothetical protein
MVYIRTPRADGQGTRDNAPTAVGNPPVVLPNTVVSNSNWRLFKAGTTASGANLPNSSQDRINSFDEKTQKFAKGGTVLQTSVYRMFPASKSTTTDEDDDIVAVNESMRQLFASKPDNKDKRHEYQLVGAIWLDDPEHTFKSNSFFQNQDGQSTDDSGAMVAGEDRLSGTAMESFTQLDQPNCFSWQQPPSCRSSQKARQDPPQLPG